MDDAIQISKNFIKGEPIKDAQVLIKLANEKKSVYHEVLGNKTRFSYYKHEFLYCDESHKL